MTIPEILKELEPCTGHFPMEAMKAAIEQREAITPELLHVLEMAAADPAEVAERDDYMVHVFATYLLAQFREKRAYPLLVKIVSAPGEIPLDLFGDTVTEALDRLFASVYDGNPALLHGLVENEQVNGYVRQAAMTAFLVLENTGQVSRDAVLGYFSSLFQGKLTRTRSYAWDGLISAVADLPAPELLQEIRQAYADNLAVDLTAPDMARIEQDILLQPPPRREDWTLIIDAIDEMEWWAAFELDDDDASPETEEPDDIQPPEPEPEPAPAPTSHVAPKPFIREPKVGRNDPCPCGSGKKYKKCCGAN